jgi:hypothetical protein
MDIDPLTIALCLGILWFLFHPRGKPSRWPGRKYLIDRLKPHA